MSGSFGGVLAGVVAAPIVIGAAVVGGSVYIAGKAVKATYSMVVEAHNRRESAYEISKENARTFEQNQLRLLEAQNAVKRAQERNQKMKAETEAMNQRLAQQLAEEQQRVIDQNEKEIRLAIGDLRQRQNSAFETMLQNNEQEALQQAKEFKQNADNVNVTVEAYISGSTTETRQRIETQYAERKEEAARLSADVGCITEKIAQIVQVNENHQLATEIYIENVRESLSDLLMFDRRFISEAQLRSVKNDISNAEQNIRIGAHQAAVATSVMALAKALDLKEDAFAKKLEYETLYEQWSYMSQKLRCDVNEAINALTTDEESGINYNIDTFTDGLASKLVEELSELETSVNSCNMPSDGLKAAIAQLSDLSKRMDEINDIAVHNLLKAHSGEEAMGRFMTILMEEFDMELVDFCYKKNNPNDQATYVLQEPETLDEVVITLNPIKDKNNRVTDQGMRLDYLESAEASPQDAERVLRTVAERLTKSSFNTLDNNKNEHQATGFKCIPEYKGGYGNAGAADTERLRSS